MKINSDRTGTDGCIIFASQDDGSTRKKNRALNITAAVERLFAIHKSRMFTDPSYHLRIIPAKAGADLELSYKEKTQRIHIQDYSIYNEKDLDELSLDLIRFFGINMGGSYSPEDILFFLKESISVRKENSKSSRKDSVCDAEDLARYVMSETRKKNGAHVSRYSRESLNALLFYMRALSLTMGMGRLYNGEVKVKDGRVITPADSLLKEHEDDGKVYIRARYGDTELDPAVRDIADTVLAIAPETDEGVKNSLDFHVCYTDRAGTKTRYGEITDEEVIADFSTWEKAEEDCKKEVLMLSGSGYGQLALPVFE